MKADMMNPIDPAKLSTTQRARSGVVTPLNRAAPARPVADAATNGASSSATRAPLTTALTGPTAGAEPPVNADRVREIRKAVEDGSYPLVPTRIADAMIAAGYLLRAPK